MLLPSQRENKPTFLMVPSATQRKMTSKAGPLVEVPVEIGGANGDSPGKSVEMDEDEETMTV